MKTENGGLIIIVLVVIGVLALAGLIGRYH